MSKEHTPEPLWTNLDKQQIIQDVADCWNKYCESLKGKSETFTRDDVKALMGIVHDSASTRIAELEKEVAELKKQVEYHAGLSLKNLKAFRDLQSKFDTSHERTTSSD